MKDGRTEGPQGYCESEKRDRAGRVGVSPFCFTLLKLTILGPSDRPSVLPSFHYLANNCLLSFTILLLIEPS